MTDIYSVKVKDKRYCFVRSFAEPNCPFWYDISNCRILRSGLVPTAKKVSSEYVASIVAQAELEKEQVVQQQSKPTRRAKRKHKSKAKPQLTKFERLMMHFLPKEVLQ